jgi:ATP-dependent exoDNAse (exonuclease V) beta subunit
LESDAGYCFNIVSSDVLYLVNSPEIQFIIACISYLSDPGDLVSKAIILLNASLHTGGIFTQPVLEISEENRINRELPEEISQFFRSVANMSLFATVERIIGYFKLNHSETSRLYLQVFNDWVFQLENRKTMDYHRFIDEWEKNGKKVVVSLPPGQDAIRIMTIHKAKGLEFKIVIIPFCNWKLDHETQSPFIWSNPGIPPFNLLDLLPISYSAGLKESIFAIDWQTEKLKTAIDNLNLLYVAFTRACDGLYVFCPATQEGDKGPKTIADSLHQLFLKGNEALADNDPLFVDLNSGYNKQTQTFSIGTLPRPADNSKSPGDTIPLLHGVTSQTNKIILRKKSDQFLLASEAGKRVVTDHGKMMHRLFSEMVTLADLDRALNKLRIGGLINEKEENSLKDEIRIKLEQPEVADWFNGHWQVRTESQVLLPDNSVKIPDRILIRDNKAVVIDYKFGLIRSKSHHDQVASYKNLLASMGYQLQAGYVWYYYLDEVVKV